MFFIVLKLNCAHIAALGAFLMTLSLHFKTFKNKKFHLSDIFMFTKS